ncbi:hypothetical protein D6D17_03476, partial [Aureobasidium pullulans]
MHYDANQIRGHREPAYVTLHLAVPASVASILLSFTLNKISAEKANKSNPTSAKSKRSFNFLAITIPRFPIEDLSPPEWRAEHERTRASLGDEAYLALRKSEIDQKMRSSNDVLNDMIKAGQWTLPPIGNDVKPDRIGFGNGRVFNVEIKYSVPGNITDA